MLRYISFLLFIFLINGCIQQRNLFVENSRINGIENPYNYDNKIFIPQKEYIYRYVIIKNADSLKYKIVNDSVFELIQPYDTSQTVVDYLSIKTLKNKGPIFTDHENYNQTEIILSQLDHHQKALTRELTGVIENDKNIWLHPFRSNIFQMLQFAPFPFVKFSTDKPYKWNLKIGKHWDELKDINWKGNLNLKCNYRNIGFESVNIPIGHFRALKTISTGKSKLGKNYLITYYNDSLGFIKFEYDLINGEKIILTLEEIKQ